MNITVAVIESGVEVLTLTPITDSAGIRWGGRPDAELEATLKISAAYAARLLPGLVAATPPRSFIVHNVNFPYPGRPDAPIRRTVPARMVITKLFGPAQDDGTHRFVFRLGDDVSPAEPLTDHAALAQGCISHSILDYTRLGQP